MKRLSAFYEQLPQQELTGAGGPWIDPCIIDRAPGAAAGLAGSPCHQGAYIVRFACYFNIKGLIRTININQNYSLYTIIIV